MLYNILEFIAPTCVMYTVYTLYTHFVQKPAPPPKKSIYDRDWGTTLPPNPIEVERNAVQLNTCLALLDCKDAWVLSENELSDLLDSADCSSSAAAESNSWYVAEAWPDVAEPFVKLQIHPAIKKFVQRFVQRFPNWTFSRCRKPASKLRTRWSEHLPIKTRPPSLSELARMLLGTKGFETFRAENPWSPNYNWFHLYESRDDYYGPDKKKIQLRDLIVTLCSAESSRDILRDS
jgi:hypothetical protein